jgi:hypothetical protein
VDKLAFMMRDEMKNKEGLTLKDMADYRFQCLNIMRDLNNTYMQCKGMTCAEVDENELITSARNLYNFVIDKEEE